MLTSCQCDLSGLFDPQGDFEFELVTNIGTSKSLCIEARDHKSKLNCGKSIF